MNVLEGKLVAEGMKIGIVCARFNEFITSKLLGGAMDALVRHGVADSDVDVAWVPGAFEIPLAAQKMAATGKYDAILCLGAVIKGSTSSNAPFLRSFTFPAPPSSAGVPIRQTFPFNSAIMEASPKMPQSNRWQSDYDHSHDQCL